MSELGSFTRRFSTGSPLVRAFGLGLLVLLLQIPVAIIEGVVRERQSRRSEAAAEVSGKWGGQQTIVGPVLVIPYRVSVDSQIGDQIVSAVEERNAYVLPDRVETKANMASEVRARGIFRIPLYVSQIEIRGRFDAIDLAPLGPMEQIGWDRARVAFLVEDTRGITETSRLTFGTRSLELLPGTGTTASGISAAIDLGTERTNQEFRLNLSLRGAEALFFAPIGKESRVTLASKWPHPSFAGSYLPEKREVSSSGFSAEYSVPHLGRDYPSLFGSGSSSGVLDPHLAKAKTQTLGVELSVPIDHYRMAERSTKYGLLFLTLTFAALWLFEVQAALLIHGLAYVLIGFAMCMFFLLELALSEHIGFPAAYSLASGLVTMLVFSYTLSVLGRPRRAFIMMGVLGVLYGGLFVLLDSEDYALLIGSLGLFVALAIVMFLTRNVDLAPGRDGKHGPSSDPDSGSAALGASPLVGN